jgi:hypothetical protein
MDSQTKTSSNANANQNPAPSSNSLAMSTVLIIGIIAAIIFILVLIAMAAAGSKFRRILGRSKPLKSKSHGKSSRDNPYYNYNQRYPAASNVSQGTTNSNTGSEMIAVPEASHPGKGFGSRVNSVVQNASNSTAITMENTRKKDLEAGIVQSTDLGEKIKADKIVVDIESDAKDGETNSKASSNESLSKYLK